MLFILVLSYHRSNFLRIDNPTLAKLYLLPFLLEFGIKMFVLAIRPITGDSPTRVLPPPGLIQWNMQYLPTNSYTRITSALPLVKRGNLKLTHTQRSILCGVVPWKNLWMCSRIVQLIVLFLPLCEHSILSSSYGNIPAGILSFCDYFRHPNYWSKVSITSLKISCSFLARREIRSYI